VLFHSFSRDILDSFYLPLKFTGKIFKSKEKNMLGNIYFWVAISLIPLILGVVTSISPGLVAALYFILSFVALVIWGIYSHFHHKGDMEF